MALVDSESAFRKRCEQLQTGLADKAEAQNLTTFSTFAFSAGSPQNQVSDAEIAKLAETIYGTPTLGDVATIRRLHFESCTYLLNDMKTNAINVDSSEPLKKLPFIEKQTRLEAQRKRITGLLHKPDQKPVIDMAFHIVETGALTYIGMWTRLRNSDCFLHCNVDTARLRLSIFYHGSHVRSGWIS